MKDSKTTNFDYLFQFSNIDLSNQKKANSFFQRWKLLEIDNDKALKSIRNIQKTLHEIFEDIIEKKALVESKAFRFFEIQFKQIPQDIFWKIENNSRIVLSSKPMLNRELGLLDLPQALRFSPKKPYLEKLVIELYTFLKTGMILKIKKCPFCEEYYLARNIRRKSRCYSEKCEKAYQRYKKRKQRKNDPVKYV